MFLGGQPRYCIYTSASRGLSATAEFLPLNIMNDRLKHTENNLHRGTKTQRQVANHFDYFLITKTWPTRGNSNTQPDHYHHHHHHHQIA